MAWQGGSSRQRAGDPTALLLPAVRPARRRVHQRACKRRGTCCGCRGGRGLGRRLRLGRWLHSGQVAAVSGGGAQERAAAWWSIAMHSGTVADRRGKQKGTGSHRKTPSPGAQAPPPLLRPNNRRPRNHRDHRRHNTYSWAPWCSQLQAGVTGSVGHASPARRSAWECQIRGQKDDAPRCIAAQSGF